MEEPKEFSFETEAGAEGTLPYPPEVVWKAITNESETTHWLGVIGYWPADPAPGKRFWTRSTGLGYMAFEYLEFTPPRRLKARGLYTGRVFTWELQRVDGGTRLRVSVQPGPNDTKWETDQDHNSIGPVIDIRNLRSYLKGDYDAQRFPFFGVRTKPLSPESPNVQVVTEVYAWASAAGLRVGDKIVSVNGEEIPRSPFSFAPLYWLARKHRAGETVTLTVHRENKTLEMVLRLYSWREAAEAMGADIGPPPGFDRG